MTREITKINSKALPAKPQIEKAVFGNQGTTFGALYSWPEHYPLFEQQQPQIVEMILDSGKSIERPEGWSVDVQLYSTTYNLGEFAAYWFEVPHALKQLRRGSGIPTEIAELLSGYLQTGEGFTFRNFEHYLHFRMLKFLPFLITEESFRFFVYIPTRENVLAAIPVFQRVLEEIKPLIPEIDSLLWDIYALVRLDEVDSASTLIKPAMNDLLEIIEARLKPFRRKLGFVYANISGSQDVRPFNYDMFIIQETVED